MSAGGERHSGDCRHGNLSQRCKDCRIERLEAALRDFLACYDAENGFASWGTTPEAWRDAAKLARAALAAQGASHAS